MEDLNEYIPTIYASEEEGSFRNVARIGGQSSFNDSEIDGAIAAHQRNPKRDIVTAGIVHIGKLDSTGGALSRDGPRMELGSPEYRTVRQLVARMQDNECRWVEIAMDYMSKVKDCPGIDIDMRVIDFKGSTAGPQYNFGYPDALGTLQGKTGQYVHRLVPFMTPFLIGRGLLTGTGLVRPGGVYFAQKLYPPDLKSTGYTRKNSLLRTVGDEGGLRIESRSPDRNISPFALGLEIGGTAIGLAVARSPYVAQFKEYTKAMDDDTKLRRAAPIINRMEFDEDGNLELTTAQRWMLSMQRATHETFLEKLAVYDESGQLSCYAQDAIELVDDMLAAGDGKGELKDLADRQDWAMKLLIIMKQMARDRQLGIERHITDFTAQVTDMRYGSTRVRRSENGTPVVQRRGDGFRMRAKGQFRNTPSEAEVTAARKPPTDTRAAIRADLLRSYKVQHVYWDAVHIQGEEGDTIRVDLDPLDSQLTLAQERGFARAVPRQVT